MKILPFVLMFDWSFKKICPRKWAKLEITYNLKCKQKKHSCPLWHQFFVFWNSYHDCLGILLHYAISQLEFLKNADQRNSMALEFIQKFSMLLPSVTLTYQISCYKRKSCLACILFSHLIFGIFSTFLVKLLSEKQTAG